MWGGRDRLIPPENAVRFHRDIAGSTLAMFDDLGHAPEEEAPARTVVPCSIFCDPSGGPNGNASFVLPGTRGRPSP